MAGIRASTPLADALDLLTVIAVERPLKEVGEVLDRWRAQVHRHLAATGGAVDERDTWGTLPHQQAATRRLMGQTGRG